LSAKGGKRGSARAREEVGGRRPGGEEGGGRGCGFFRAKRRARAGKVVGAAADAAGIGEAGAAVRAGGGRLGAVGSIGAIAAAAEDEQDVVGCGVVGDGRVDGPCVGGRRSGRGGWCGGQEGGDGRGVGGRRGRQGGGRADVGRAGGEEELDEGREFVRVGVGGVGEEGGGEPFAAYGVQNLVGEHGGSVVTGWKLGLE